MNWRVFTSLVLSVIFWSLLPALQAQPQPSNPNPDQANASLLKPEENLDKALNLNPQQKTALETNRDAYHQELQETLEKLQVRKLEIHDLLTATTLDKEALSKKHQEAKDLMGKIMDARLKAILAIREILSVEQRSTLQNQWEMLRKLPSLPATGFPAGKTAPRSSDSSMPSPLSDPFDY